MSTFHVTHVFPNPKPWQSAHGQMVTYLIKGSLDNGPEEQAQINTKADKPKVPYVGEMIDCVVSKDDPTHGKTLKRNQGVSTGPSSTGASFTPTQKRDYTPSPASEIPYLSLKAAVEFASAKASKELDITGEQVVVMAQIFQRYLEGDSVRTSPTAVPAVSEYQDDFPPIDEMQ